MDQVIHFQAAEQKKNCFLFCCGYQKGFFFGLLVIQLVWYVHVLKQLFTSVSLKVVDFYHALSLLSKYPPLFPFQWLLFLGVHYLLLSIIHLTVLQSFHSLKFLPCFALLPSQQLASIITSEIMGEEKSL